MTTPRFLVTASPHLRGPQSTPAIMWNVVGSLVPTFAAAVLLWGPSAILVTAASVLGAVLPEALVHRRAVRDGSAAITGVLLAFTLPPGIPLWMAALGGAFGIAFGKLVFGGLGQNPFNPALLGRAFLQAAFPVSLTTWPVQGGDWWALRGDNLAIPFTAPVATDVATAATPLGLWKFGFTGTPLDDLILGTTGGCIGETSAVAILVGGAYLAARNFLNWRIPVSIFATVAVFAGILHLVDPARYATPWLMLFSGGLVLGACYMATDMVTSPVTNRGSLVFGVGIGLLVVLIRTWGGLAEGVMYAILLMNALVPFIDRATQPKVFGARRPEVAK